MQNFAIEAPFNALSFGNVSFSIVNEIRKRGLNPNIRPIGDSVDLSAIKADHAIIPWLKERVEGFEAKHDRNTPVLKIWHINGSLSSFSNSQNLLTFYELDEPTRTEVNILKNQNKTFVTSKFTKSIFESVGVENVVYVPLGFDSENFSIKTVRRPSAKVVFGLVGKLEKRKAHHKVIKAWAKKYGNNKNYMLNCAIQNPFIDPQRQSEALLNILGGERYYNINFLGFMKTNELYNEFLNSNDVILAMSHAEGFGLPEFHSLALGKHGVVLNAHAYKDWANTSNAVMVEPTGKIDSVDGTFFHKGHTFNQGRYFDWDEDEFISASEEAEKRFLANPVNESGIKLQTDFSYSNTVDVILQNI